MPTIGVTDRSLVAIGAEPGPAAGAAAGLRLVGELVSYRLRTRAGVRAVVVHAGWRVDAETARAVALSVNGRGRTPEPLGQVCRAFLSLLGCQGPGSVYRLAQIVAAAAVCLELSASASASNRGSENFAMAHLQQSGRA